MNVGLLIITHGRVGQDLLDTAIAVLGTCPLQTRCLSVPMNCDPDQLLKQGQALIDELDQGDGVLIMTDLYGSTPSNIACKLVTERVIVVAGLNLPMLVRVLNYPRLGLAELKAKALSGGRDGVLTCS
jgi:PTS system ascorbate-specific IIA component